MKRILISATFLFCAILTTILNAQIPKADEASLITRLQKFDAEKSTDAELFDIAAACRHLTVIGTESSVPALEKLLDDPRTADYARTALKNIDADAARDVLQKHSAKKDNASPISEKLKTSRNNVAKIAAGGAEGLELFSKLLKSDDKYEFNAALEGFRQYPDRNIVDVLAKEQATLKPDRRIAAILSLCDRTDVAPVPQEIFDMVSAAGNDLEIREAAIFVLGAFPDEKTIHFLFRLRGDLTKQAVEALTTLKSKEIDKIVLGYLDGNDPNDRMTAAQIAGGRHIVAAEALLWKASRNEQWGGVQFTAFIALGRIVGTEGFSKLLDDYNSSNFEKIRAYILIGVKDACKISADRDAYASLIAEKLKDDSLKLELLALVGGGESLKRIVEITKTTDNDSIRDTATKILGEWTGAEVAPFLLDLSASLTEQKYKVRTMRGFLRAVRQFDMPNDVKRTLCEKAFDIAQRDEEKKMIAEVLGKPFNRHAEDVHGDSEK